MLSGGKVLMHRSAPVTGVTELMLASLKQGSVKLQMRAGKSGMGPVSIDVSLVGDVNGNNHVGALDLALIRSLRGVHQGQPGYSRSADVNGDGVINGRDWQLARSNLGVSTLVRPLSASVALSPASNQSGTGVVTTSTVLLSGQTEPGATVRLVPAVSGSATAVVPTTRADCARELSALDQPADDRGDSRADPGHGSFRSDCQRNEFDCARRRGHRLGSNSDRGDPGRQSERRPGLTSHGDGHGVGLRRRQRHRPRASVYHTDATVPASTSAEAAASAAAYTVLVVLFPDQKARFDATLGAVTGNRPGWA